MMIPKYAIDVINYDAIISKRRVSLLLSTYHLDIFIDQFINVETLVLTRGNWN
jgi:hypothetical protein